MENTIWGDDALDSLEAAAYLGIYRQSLWQHYKGWGIPSYRVGGQTVFLKPDLDKWMAERKRSQAA